MPEVEAYDEGEPELNFGPQHPGARAVGKGNCPHCGLSMPIRSGSGRVWHHGPNNKYRCKGSGQPPVDGTFIPREGGLGTVAPTEELQGQCAMCDDRYRVRRDGRIHHHRQRGEPCAGVDWPPGALACLLPNPARVKRLGAEGQRSQTTS